MEIKEAAKKALNKTATPTNYCQVWFIAQCGIIAHFFAKNSSALPMNLKIPELQMDSIR